MHTLSVTKNTKLTKNVNPLFPKNPETFKQNLTKFKNLKIISIKTINKK
ncbi:hypothetical protein NEIFL0001_1850 [Neisseria flavescens SK114]|nr:hypothetical protein NEIFL0001_1850 [Neisseria flavescens SK114]